MWSSACSPHVHIGFLWVLWFFSPSPKKHTSQCTGKNKLPLVVNECVDGALWWPGVPLRVYSCLTHSVPRIGFGSNGTLIRIKAVTEGERVNLLQHNAWMTKSQKHIGNPTDFYFPNIHKHVFSAVKIDIECNATCKLHTSNTQLKEFIQYCFIHIPILPWASGFPVNTKCTQTYTALHWHGLSHKTSAYTPLPISSHQVICIEHF